MSYYEQNIELSLIGYEATKKYYLPQVSAYNITEKLLKNRFSGDKVLREVLSKFCINQYEVESFEKSITEFKTIKIEIIEE